MKVFDEKGKLFGKINIIDLLVILVVLVALVVVGIKVFGGDKAVEAPPATSPSVNTPAATPAATPVATPTPQLKTKLTYTVRVTAQHKDVAEWLAQFVNIDEGVSDQLQHSGVLVEDAYVVDFWTEPCRFNVTASGTVEPITAAQAEEAGLVDIYAVVEAVIANTVTNSVGGQEVRVGKGNILKTQHLEFTHGYVVDCKWEPWEPVVEE